MMTHVTKVLRTLRLIGGGVISSDPPAGAEITTGAVADAVIPAFIGTGARVAAGVIR